MKKSICFLSLLLLFTLVGCTPTNETEALKQRTVELENENNELRSELDKLQNDEAVEDFTYLEGLTEDEFEQYSNFLQSGDSRQLNDFSPEKIVLIFLELVMEHNDDRIYALTYDHGNLPSLETFKEEYNQYLAYDYELDYLSFRYYDEVYVDEAASDEDFKAVRLSISFGSQTFIKVFPLRKDNKSWKMDNYHLVEEAKLERNGNNPA